MVVTWNTLEATSDSFVEYGETGTDQKISGKAKVFNDSVYQFVHRVTIINLKPTTKYGNVHTLKSNMSRESFVNQFVYRVFFFSIFWSLTFKNSALYEPI